MPPNHPGKHAVSDLFVKMFDVQRLEMGRWSFHLQGTRAVHMRAHTHLGPGGAEHRQSGDLPKQNQESWWLKGKCAGLSGPAVPRGVLSSQVSLSPATH